MSLTTREIAAAVDGVLAGSPDIAIRSIEQLDRAAEGQLTFIGDSAHAARWPTSGASAAVIADGLDADPGDSRALIRVGNADLAIATLLRFFAPDPVQPEEGIHETAVVHRTAAIGSDVCIGPHCVIGPGADIGDGCVLHALVTVMDRARLGANCELWPGVVIRDRCVLGAGCLVHPNTTIGADGFGFRADEADGRLVKIPHNGTVQIGDDVEIGAGTAIDRGKFSPTRVGDGTKIDNLVQIGHNCQIGCRVVIAGSTGIAGSVTIGDDTVIGGMVAIKDHVRIGARSSLTGGAQVMCDIPDGERWAGSPARPGGVAVREYAAIRHLPELVKDMKARKRVERGAGA